MTGTPVAATSRPDGTASADPLLVVESLTTTFGIDGSEFRAVDGVSFELQRGATLGIVGESGSGKSVLTRSILGLLRRQRAQVTGSARFEGRDLISAPEKELRGIRGAGIGIIFQDPMTALNPVMKVGKQVAEVLTVHKGMNRAEANRRAVELLDEVHIPSARTRAGQYPHELSGGMRQRVAIAAAIACRPRLLIADEATTALDVTIQAEILDLLDELRRDLHMSMLLISHDLGVVMGRCDHVAVMYAGRIVELGRTTDVLVHPMMPYTRGLLDAIPKVDDPAHTRLAVIPGQISPAHVRAPGCSFESRCALADDQCRAAAPELQPAGAERSYACWHPAGADGGTVPVDERIESTLGQAR
ncbi:MAG TPA: ABC transporter ATP-binding protein [Acidimicrobiales bacterium]|jgi:peptide/nickel transport system ATP-binding protein|nr:ABC transporter ATP-binding protein [Acidimicrobiales bacterium]